MIKKKVFHRNIFANFLGSTWTGLIALLFLPYYVRLMGGEAFAVIGIFISLVNIISVLDMGIGPTLNRELAACSVHNNREKMRSTLRTLEYVYLPIILGICFVLLAASPLIAERWLNNNKLPTFVVMQSFMLMSMVITLHMSINFYSAGISGLQFQVFLNTVNSVMAALRYAVVVPVMLIFSPSPVVFFVWQIGINILHLLIVRSVLWRKIHIPLHTPSFQPGIIQKIWRFSFGVSIINFLGMISINMDKILLSKLLSLEQLGYYSVASIIAMSIAPRLASPFFAATYPRLTQYVTKGDSKEIVHLYHKMSMVVATMVMPATIFICFYSDKILLLWTGSITIAEYADTVLIFLSLGCSFTAVMYIPYALQLAHGWTKLGMWTNLVSLMAIIPVILFMYPNYGANGVAFSWLLVNSIVILINVAIMHNILLKGQGVRWFFYDNGLVILMVGVSCILLRIIFNGETLLQLFVVLVSLYLVSILGISSQRIFIFNFMRTLVYAKK